MIWPHRVILHPGVDAVDERGNPIRRPGPPVDSPAYVQPRAATDDGTAVAELAVAYLPPHAPRLDAFSRLVWQDIEYETVGAAVELHTPIGRHHWRVELRKVGA